MLETPPLVDSPRSIPEPRRRLLDNPRVLAVAFAMLLGLIGGLFWVSRRGETDTQVLTDVLLYPLLAVSVALLLTLGLVLTRNLLKLWEGHRQAVPFAKYRAKLVGALLAMSIIPAVLVLISGSEIISNSATRWFSQPVDEVLSGAKTIASQFHREQQESVTLRAQQLARSISLPALTAGDEAALRNPLSNELATMGAGLIELYRKPAAAPATGLVFVTAVELSMPPRESARASADRLAAQAVETRSEKTSQEVIQGGGALVRTATPIVNTDGQIVGAVVVSSPIDGQIDHELRRATSAYESYKGLFLRQEPILASYLTIFLTVTLLILIAATWLGLYLAKRITRPVQQLAEGARAIGAGHLDVRLEPETGDELGSLVEAFNMMAAELQTNRGKLEQSSRDLERKNTEVEGRRRYIETILERVATGVISLDAAGRLSTINGAAQRLLGIESSAVGQPVRDVFAREDLAPLTPLIDAVEARVERGFVQEVTLTRDGREINLATAGTVLAGADRSADGAVLVLDDVTPLIRAQRVAAWRDVARRLAHEIKNPLTPIQLSAERLRRHFAGAPAKCLRNRSALS